MCHRYGEGEAIRVEARNEGLRFPCTSGIPVGEPVWPGYVPIVMNTDLELRTAFSESRDGTFISK